MKKTTTNLQRLAREIPILLLSSLVNTVISSTLALVVMFEMQARYPNSIASLLVAILVAIGSWAWISFNYQLKLILLQKENNE